MIKNPTAKQLARRLQQKAYRKANAVKIRARMRAWQSANREKINASSKAWRNANLDKVNARCRTLYKINPAKKKAAAISYYATSREKAKARVKAYRSANPAQVRNTKRNYKRKRKRKQTDPLYKFACIMRNQIYLAFKRKGYRKDSSTAAHLGFTYAEAQKHIESQFTTDMCMENYPEWEYDHIKPLASAKNKKEFIKLCHYTNLQPLWRTTAVAIRHGEPLTYIGNREKGDK